MKQCGEIDRQNIQQNIQQKSQKVKIKMRENPIPFQF